MDDLTSIKNAVDENHSILRHLEHLIKYERDYKSDLGLFNHFLNRNFIPDGIGILQKTLVSNWMLQKSKKQYALDLRQVGFRAFSQNDEDGILLYIFTLIGTTNKIAVDIGANCFDSTTGIPECNTANLVVNHGWHSLIIDSDDENIRKINDFFSRCKETQHLNWETRSSRKKSETSFYSPICKKYYVTRRNINQILRVNKIHGETDLLSIDIDGMDYWIWDAIKVIMPRVVVIEFENKIKLDLSVVRTYNTNNTEQYTVNGQLLNGASLKAVVKLAKRLGYRLIGVNAPSFNAFFMKANVGEHIFHEIPYEECYNLPIFHQFEEGDYYGVLKGWEEV